MNYAIKYLKYVLTDDDEDQYQVATELGQHIAWDLGMGVNLGLTNENELGRLVIEFFQAKKVLPDDVFSKAKKETTKLVESLSAQHDPSVEVPKSQLEQGLERNPAMLHLTKRIQEFAAEPRAGIMPLPEQGELIDYTKK